MDIRSKLSEEHSKAVVMQIADYIGEDDSRFAALMECVLSDDALLVQRGAWAMRWTLDKHPELVKPYLGSLLEKMDAGLHVALKRNVLKILEEMERVPEELQEIVVDKCFQYLDSRKEPVAVRVFAMTILEKECRAYPELMKELEMMIKAYFPHESAGFQSRGKKILHRINKK